MNSAPPAPSPSSFFSPPPSLPSSSPPTLKFEYPNSHPDSSDYPSASSFNGPYMGILLVVLLVSFFLMASFSVYVRRHAFSVHGGEAGLGGGRARGLDRAAIDGLPIVVYHCAKGEFKDDEAAHAHEWSRPPDCVVCLTDFQEAENVRLLPKCEHCFHPECIDMWLFSHTTCPLCRRSLLPPAAPANTTGTDTCINVPEPSSDTPPPPPPPPSSPLTPR